jgi:surface protein
MKPLLALLFLVCCFGVFGFTPSVSAYTSDDFVITVDTSISGSTGSDQFKLPTVGGGYDAVVDWGDGSTTTLSGTPGLVTHTYPAPGVYEIVVTPNTPTGFPRIRFNDADAPNIVGSNNHDEEKLLTIEQWGTTEWTSMASAFHSAINLTSDGSDAPNLSNVTDMRAMFFGAEAFDSDVSNWDTSNVTNMSQMFARRNFGGGGPMSFNQPLNSWDVSNVTDMLSMLNGATSFNQPLNTWNVSSLTDASGMFQGATAFNQDISGWDVSSLTNASAMFYGATSFNQPLNSWDVSNVTDMNGMFYGATTFNQPLNSWAVPAAANIDNIFQNSAFNQDITGWTWLFNPARTSWQGLFASPSFSQDITGIAIPAGITDLSFLFTGNTSFNQDISGWNVSNVTNMDGMFQGATAFNQDISGWNVSNVVVFGCYGECESGMFMDAASFNQPLNTWNVSSAQRMDNMFNGATTFNQPLNTWDVSSAQSFHGMFAGATSFNQDLSSWTFRTDGFGLISSMFSGATSFNQDLSGWDVTFINRMNNAFDNSGLSPTNYSNMLNAWSLQALPSNVTLGANGISYLASAGTARQTLIDTYSWIINDAGEGYAAPSGDTFITRWNTTLDPSTPNELNFYLSSDATAFTIDWGDGTTQYFATGPDDFVNHTYGTPGIKTVTITGNFPYFYAGCYEGDAYNKLIDVTQWGTGQWNSFNTSFGGCTHLEGFSATDVPDLSQVTDMAEAFGNAASFNGDLSTWDVSNVTDMTNMFSNATAFNRYIGNWDVSNLAYMQSMFNGATSFNQDISRWNPAAGDMYTMFLNASSFNQDISSWNVSGVTQIYNALAGTAISASNYTKLLLGWSTQILPDSMSLGYIGGTYDADLDDYLNLTPYCASAQSARDIITGTYNWSITDGGQVTCQTATYSAGENGSLTGATSQYIVDGQAGTPVTAVPATGYRFAGWSDGSTANPRTDGNLTGAIVVNAIFVANGGSNEATKVGVRAERLIEAIKTMPVVGSIAKFVSSVRDFLTYLTDNEDQLETLTTDERTTIIVALRDILAFLLRMVPVV